MKKANFWDRFWSLALGVVLLFIGACLVYTLYVVRHISPGTILDTLTVNSLTVIGAFSTPTIIAIVALGLRLCYEALKE